MKGLLRSVASVPGGEYVLVFLSRLWVVVFPFFVVFIVFLPQILQSVRGVSKRSVSDDEFRPR